MAPPSLVRLFTGFLQASSTAGAGGSSSTPSACSTGVRMIVARASTEQPGTGIIGAVANNVAQQISGSDIVAVDYPATLQNYVSSESQGVTAMTKLVTDYQTACPDGKIVLMGYSQGAQVAADVACGTSEAGFAQTKAVNSDNIAAIVLMGDPSHVPGQSFDQGNSTKNGLFPRKDFSGCAALEDKMVSFCDNGDTFCDSGPENAQGLATHLSYVNVFGTQAAKFVVGLAG